MGKAKAFFGRKGIVAGAVFTLLCLFFFSQGHPAQTVSGGGLVFYGICAAAWIFFLGFLCAGRFCGRKLFGIFTIAFAAVILVCFFVEFARRSMYLFDNLSTYRQTDFSYVAGFFRWMFSAVALTSFVCLAATADLFGRLGRRRISSVFSAIATVSAAFFIVAEMLHSAGSLTYLISLAVLAVAAFMLYASAKEETPVICLCNPARITVIVSLAVSGAFALFMLIFFCIAAFSTGSFADINSIIPLLCLFSVAFCISLSLLLGGKNASCDTPAAPESAEEAVS